jgi:hypothetical protein
MEYLSFKEAFKDAKKAGDKTFTFKGKRYTTATAEEQRSAVVAKAATGSGRGSAAGRRASDEDSGSAGGSATIPKGADKAPKSEGKDTSGPSNMQRVLYGMGAGAGVAGATAIAARMSRADKAARAAMMAKEEARVAPTLRRSGAAAEAARKEARESLAKEPPMFRAASAEEKKAGMMKAEKAKKSSPRDKTREKEDIEFRKGGMAKKRK